MWYALMNTYYLTRARLRSPIEPSDTGHIEMRVLPHHIDGLRHMNNSVYSTLAEAGRWDHLIRSGYASAVRERRWYAVVTGQTLNYRRSLKLGERFTLQTRPLGLRERDVLFEHSFVRDGETVARIVAALRVLRRSGGSVPLGELAEAFPALTTGDVPQWVRQWP
jgi:acyl-CoA thioesterase FadM